MARWHLWHGNWWMVQASLAGWFSLGIHIEPRRRTSPNGGYGPYVDLHLGVVILSLGRNPVWSGDLEAGVSVSRGGRSA